MWYVVQTMSGEEEKFKKTYETINNNSVMCNLFIPLIELKKRYHQKWNSVKKIMFPGYVFVETEQIEKFAEKMQDVKCFSKLLKAEDKILTVTEEEKHFLESIMDENYCVNYSQGFIVGENVVITEGVLRNKNALIRKVDHHRRIAMLDVNIFGRRTPVEVGFGAFAKVTDEQWEQIRQNNISRHEHVNKSTRDDNVKIITGVFHGMTGKLVSLNTANNECVVELQLFDADVNVSFGREEVEFL